MNSYNTPRYVVVTAAYNEEAHIERLIGSVVNQTVRPLRWVIVSDASTDRTDEIVSAYANQHEFISLYRITGRHERNFAAQVIAINTGIEQTKALDYDFVGNLDADVSFGPDYFASVLARFMDDPLLGLAGGYICEPSKGKFVPRPTNSPRSVAHAVQLFRRECFEQFGCYVPLPYGGPDWHAEVSCRMGGWRVASFPEIRVQHHRTTGSAGGLLRGWYRQGLMDFSLGSHPVFEAAKLLRRVRCRPYLLGALARLCGFLWAACRGDQRGVSEQFVTFLQREQMERFWRAIRLSR